MNKISLYAISFLCLTSSLYAAQTEKDKFLMTITSAHTRVFSKDNLITERILPEDSAIWNALMSEIAQYVQRNGGKLTPEFEKLQRASNDLLNTLKIVYGTDIAPAITDQSKKQTGISLTVANASKINKALININSIKAKIAPLAEQENNAKNVPTQLDKRWLLSAADKDLAVVLKQLALTLEVTISKVFKDAEKLQKFVALR